MCSSWGAYEGTYAKVNPIHDTWIYSNDEKWTVDGSSSAKCWMTHVSKYDNTVSSPFWWSYDGSLIFSWNGKVAHATNDDKDFALAGTFNDVYGKPASAGFLWITQMKYYPFSIYGLKKQNEKYIIANYSWPYLTLIDELDFESLFNQISNDTDITFHSLNIIEFSNEDNNELYIFGYIKQKSSILITPMFATMHMFGFSSIPFSNLSRTEFPTELPTMKPTISFEETRESTKPEDMFEGKLKCGDTLQGGLHSVGDIDLYQFQLFNNSALLFYWCGSESYDALLGVYTANFTKLYEAVDRNKQPACSFFHTQFSTHPLPASTYILEIGIFENDFIEQFYNWTIEIVCLFQFDSAIDTTHHCTTTNCWNNAHHFHDSIIDQDTTQPKIFREEFNWPNQPAVAYWDAKLFLIGLTEIHYTNLGLFGTQYNWQRTRYSQNISVAWNVRLYSQYQSFIYIFAGIYPNIDNYGEVLIRINLDNLHSDVIVINTPDPTHIFMHTKCMVAGDKFLYLVINEIILTVSTAWSSLQLGLEDYETTNFKNENIITTSDTCAITNNQKYLYIFGEAFDMGQPFGVAVRKYDTDYKVIKTMIHSSICMFSFDTIAKSITGRNGKMYLNTYGCNCGWTTLIFDPKSDQFANETILMNTTNVHYKSSQLTNFDDNIVLMLYKNSSSGSFAWHSVVTDLISINLDNTQSVSRVWPSDGFEIEYYINDFSDTSYGVYYISLYNNITTKIINASLLLNTSNDNCICDDSIYKCYNCKQHFDLKNYLTLKDNNVDQLRLMVNSNDEHTLVITKYITIQLQRCNILLNISTNITKKNDSSINFQFSSTRNCH
eukprot:237059_1